MFEADIFKAGKKDASSEACILDDIRFNHGQCYMLRLSLEKSHAIIQLKLLSVVQDGLDQVAL